MAQRRLIIVCSLLIALIGTGLWTARLLWQRRERAAVALAAVAPIPDLSRWPGELRQRIAAVSAAVRETSAPAGPLGRLAALYWANGYATEAEQALAALRRLDPHNARWPYLQADLRWRAGDEAGAEKSLLATVEIDAGYAPAWLRLADLQVKRGAADLARAGYTKAAAAGAGAARYDYSLIYFDAQHGGEREANVRRLLELARRHPGIREVHELLAGMLADRDPAGAARERREAAECERSLGTEDPWLDGLTDQCFDSNRLMLRAVALRREGRLADAERLLRKVVQLAAHEPPNPLGWQLLSDLYVKLERPAEARATLEQGMAQFPDEPEMPLLLTRLLCTTQQPDAAVGIIQKAVERWPARGDLRAALGLALHGAGRFVAAVAALRDALRLDPTLTEAQYQLGLSLLETGEPAEARAALAKALAMRSDYPEAWFALAAVDLDAGDFAAAEPLVFKVYALDPDEPNAQRLLASWHLLKGMAEARAAHPDEADRHYRAGLAVAPEFGPLLLEAGRWAARHRQWPDAVEKLEHYIRVKPADPQGFLALGLALRADGRTVEAATLLERGLEAARRAGDQAALQEFSHLLGR